MLFSILIAYRLMSWVLRPLSKPPDGKYKMHLLQTIKTRAAREGKVWIRGLTTLDEELFVVSGESSEVEVYDSVTFSFRRCWNLKELIDPWDIVSCNRNKCLYIFDFKHRDESSEILRVDQNGNLIKNWSTEDDFGEGLSVTEESNIILSIYDRNRLNEYSPDGQLVREINPSSAAGICHPLHAVKLTNGNFMVSHGDVGGDELHRVCIVDADGELKKSFGGCRGSNIGQMTRPVHLAVDGNGFVMVADPGNGRILLLDSDLRYKRDLISDEGICELREPWRIHLNAANGRLFVAENKLNNQQILIFDVE